MAQRRPAANEPDSIAAPAIVLPFRRATDVAAASVNSAPLIPATSPVERPTLLLANLREWIRIALIASVGLHLALFILLQARFHDDLERAAGAAATLASDGTIEVPVEIVVEAALPPAPSPTDATAPDKKPEPSPAAETREEPEIDHLMPPVPEAALVTLPMPPDPRLAAVDRHMPLPPDPAPVVLPVRETATALAVPEEEIAKPVPAENAPAPKAPMPLARVAPEPVLASPPAERKSAKEAARREQKSARATPSAAASPSATASANSAGRAGAGGEIDAGGSASISSYQSQVMTHLQRHRIYPPEARERGLTGVARVHFALASDGRVLSASLVGGSGAEVLDDAAVAMVKRASPFPPFPDTLQRSRMEFAAPIRFDLR